MTLLPSSLVEDAPGHSETTGKAVVKAARIREVFPSQDPEKEQEAKVARRAET